MGKRKGLFSKLKKSTIITMVSCGSFVVMTFLALLFFVRFPITPSEKIMSSIGRESIYRNNSINSLAVAESSTQTQTTTSQTSVTTQTTTAYSRHSDFVITVTTGKGFRKNVNAHSVEYDSDEYVSDYDDNSEEETKEEETTEDYENDYSDSTTYTKPDDNDYDSSYDYDWNY